MGNEFLQRPTRRRDNQSRLWSDEMVVELAKRDAAGQSTQEIAAALGVDHRQVRVKLELGLGDRLRALVASATGIVRKCMRCPQRFLSQGNHHRLCDSCRSYAAQASPLCMNALSPLSGVAGGRSGRVLPKRRHREE